MPLQDILGQLPLLKSYTHILLCFPLPDSDREPVLRSLQNATKRLIAAFPFLAGVVVHGDIAPGHSGTFSVDGFSTRSGNARDEGTSPHERNNNNGLSDENATRILHVKDLSALLPPYSAICDARAPPSMLPGTLVAPPRPAFPRVYPESTAPVLEIQVSLVKDGLLLTIAAQHNVIDATGIFYIAHVLSRLMDKDNTSPSPNADTRSAPIPEAEIKLGNAERGNLIPLLPDEMPLPDEVEMFTREYPKPLPQSILQQFKWYLVHFSDESLKGTHEEALSRPQDFIERGEKVSLNDALTAFVWKALTTVRSKHAQNSYDTTEVESGESDETQLTRAADLRRPMGLSPAYMGHMVRTANLRLSTKAVTSSSLSYLSSVLRQCLKAHTTKESISAYATLIHRTADKSKLLYAGGFNPLHDFSVSSVAHIDMPSFGKLGKPDFVRRPTFGALPGGMYIGPGSGSRGMGKGGVGEKEGTGTGAGLDAVLCLRGWEMDALRNDPLWRGRVEFIE
ncbi:uncharacterized protein BDV14DRAFT_110132 [Aspergillus stella-maris]|uniref:uncharacterized protein n=1 Tax=Aspergillus stella-maris TaxID=1810926 RepID=UPI003CCCF945